MLNKNTVNSTPTSERFNLPPKQAYSPHGFERLLPFKLRPKQAYSPHGFDRLLPFSPHSPSWLMCSFTTFTQALLSCLRLKQSSLLTASVLLKERPRSRVPLIARNTKRRSARHQAFRRSCGQSHAPTISRQQLNPVPCPDTSATCHLECSQHSRV